MTTAKNNKPYGRLFKTKIILVALSTAAVFFGLIGLYNIYVNNKTDGLNNGQITVDRCIEKDYDWRVYVCTGSYFSTGGGMIERDNVSVKVYGGTLGRDAIVEDVYPPALSTAETTSYFITGRERASVTYNIPSLILVFLALLLPIITILVFAFTKETKVKEKE